MTIVIIIFFIAIISLFGMLMFRAWEIKSGRIEKVISTRKIFPEIYFRHTEKIVLYLAKHTIQWVVLNVVKYWFIVLAKTKKWADRKLPQARIFFKNISGGNNKFKTFFSHKSVIELKSKIKHIREKVRRDHGE